MEICTTLLIFKQWSFIHKNWREFVGKLLKIEFVGKLFKIISRSSDARSTYRN